LNLRTVRLFAREPTIVLNLSKGVRSLLMSIRVLSGGF
jgi:hypothetical protein